MTWTVTWTYTTAVREGETGGTQGLIGQESNQVGEPQTQRESSLKHEVENRGRVGRLCEGEPRKRCGDLRSGPQMRLALMTPEGGGCSVRQAAGWVAYSPEEELGSYCTNSGCG